MRYITIPVPVKLIMTPTGEEHLTTFAEFLAGTVWPDPTWRDGTIDSSDALVELHKLFSDCEEGGVVELEDSLYEKFLPVATLKGKGLPQINAIGLHQLMRAIICAPKERPAPPKKD